MKTIEQLCETATGLGYWAQVKSPFVKGEPWSMGFTEHGSTGWNGRPDHHFAGTLEEVRAQADGWLRVETLAQEKDGPAIQLATAPEWEEHVETVEASWES